MMTRRRALKNTALASATLAMSPHALAQPNSSVPRHRKGGRAVHSASVALRL